MLDNLSSGTILILGLAVVVFALQFWSPGVPAARTGSPRPCAPNAARREARAPLNGSNLSQRAFARFQQSPTITLCAGSLLSRNTCDSESIQVCREMANACAKVYILAQVRDDAQEAAVRNALEEAQLIGMDPTCQIPPHRLLFCSTQPGKIAIVRQLEPSLHVDSNSAVLSELKRFHQQQLHICAPPATNTLSEYVCSH